MGTTPHKAWDHGHDTKVTTPKAQVSSLGTSALWVAEVGGAQGLRLPEAAGAPRCQFRPAPPLSASVSPPQGPTCPDCGVRTMSASRSSAQGWVSTCGHPKAEMGGHRSWSLFHLQHCSSGRWGMHPIRSLVFSKTGTRSSRGSRPASPKGQGAGCEAARDGEAPRRPETAGCGPCGHCPGAAGAL